MSRDACVCACTCVCESCDAYYDTHVHTPRSDVITTAQLEEALMTLMGVSSEAKIRSLVKVLDKDHDGNINLEEMANV